MTLALAAIAAELGMPVDAVPAGVAGVLRTFRIASYGDGCREALRQIAAPRFHDSDDEPITSPYPIGHPHRRDSEGK